jgi:hypothetical protein
MQATYFFKPVLTSLDEGKVIHSAIALTMRIMGILSLIGGIYLLVEVLKASFELTTEGTIGGLVLSVFLAAAILAIAQILFHRAESIRDLRESSFKIIPLFSTVVKALGEIYATFGVALGFGGCVYIWFAKSNPLYLLGEINRFLPTLSPEPTFFGGIFFLFYFGVTSFVILMVSYFLAEAFIVMTEMARNIRHMLTS